MSEPIAQLSQYIAGEWLTVNDQEWTVEEKLKRGFFFEPTVVDVLPARKRRDL